MTEFDDLLQHYTDGQQGKNAGLPMGFERLNKFIGIRKSIYTLIFGATGSGKSAFLHDAYILNPIDWYVQNPNTGVKLKIILFSMERKKAYILSKWLSRRIFLDYGVLIPIQKMLGWWRNNPLTKDEIEIIHQYRDYVEFITNDIISIYEGARSPSDIYRIVKSYAEENGKEEPLNEFKKVYIPNNPHEIVMPMADHLGLAKLTKDYSVKKEAIDKISEHFQYFRDHLGYSPIAVSQITRDLGNVMYQKMDSFEPTLDHVKESGRPGEDADVVISLFDPLRYNTDDKSYRAGRFINPLTGAKHFRSIKILKNTYGEDDIKVGMAFWGACGVFKELPKPGADMETFDYQQVIEGNYFKLP
jgi:replicative DNA helicase